MNVQWEIVELFSDGTNFADNVHSNSNSIENIFALIAFFDHCMEIL